MANDVEIKVKATGARGAADDIERVNSALDDTAKSGRDAGKGFERVGEGADTADTRAMGFRDTITGIQDINKGLTGDFDSIGDQLLTLGMGFGDLASGVANFGVQFAQQAATFIANTARMVATHVASVATTIAGWVAQGAAALVSGAQMAAAWLIGLGPVGLIIAAIAAIIAILVALGVDFEDVKKALGAGFDFIKNAALGVFNWVKTNWPLILAIITGPFGLAVLAISRNWETIKSGAAAVKDWISDRVDDIAGFFTSLPETITSAFSGLGDSVVSGIKSIWNNTVGGFGFTVPSWVPGVGGRGFHIPELARGGLGTGLIIAGEHGREIIDLGAGGGRVRSNPDTEVALAAAGSGGGGVTLIVQGSIVTDRDIVQIVREEFQRGGFGGLG